MREALSLVDDFEPGKAGRRLYERARTDAMCSRKLRILAAGSALAKRRESESEVLKPFKFAFVWSQFRITKRPLLGRQTGGCFGASASCCLMKLLHILVFACA